MIECLCPEHFDKSHIRLNPVTLRTLHLCEGHAILHDQGKGFLVHEGHIEESR